MNFNRIAELAEYIPDNSDYFNGINNYFDLSNQSRGQKHINRFITCYKDLSFGYHFIKYLIKHGVSLPPSVDEDALIDTYNFERYGIKNENVIHAIALNHISNSEHRDAIKALLITEAPIEEIAKRTGISETVLNYYTQLFFNIRDRREEALFVATTVYPQSRLVEMMDGYMRNTDMGSKLLRTGYNSGLDDVSYMIGLKSEDAVNIDVSINTLAAKLEASIMANGFYLARNGFLSQRSAHGINNAKNLIMAAKQSGTEQSTEDDFGLGSIGGALMEELMKSKGPEIERKINLVQAANENDELN